MNYLYAVFSTRYILRQTGEDTTRSSYYAICSFSYLTAMVTSNKALMWVNYPTQVVGKSCKPIPVMVLGVLIGRKRYPALKYLFILLIVAGVAMFMYKDDKANASKSDTSGILGKITFSEWRNGKINNKKKKFSSISECESECLFSKYSHLF